MNDKNLYQRIADVMQDVQYLQKDDKISYKEINYRAISEEKVTSSVRTALLKHGLVILPVKQEHTKEGMLTTVNTDYKIVNIDKPEEFEILASSGTGVDTQDKGVGKAMTYSYKYLLLRTFAIPTGEDPDKTSSKQLDDEMPIEAASNGQISLIESLLHNASVTEKQRTDIESDYMSMTAERAEKCIAFLKDNQVNKPLDKQLTDTLKRQK